MGRRSFEEGQVWTSVCWDAYDISKVDNRQLDIMTSYLSSLELAIVYIFSVFLFNNRPLATPPFLPGKSHGQGSPACCSSWGRRVGHNWPTELSWTEKLVVGWGFWDLCFSQKYQDSRLGMGVCSSWDPARKVVTNVVVGAWWQGWILGQPLTRCGLYAC